MSRTGSHSVQAERRYEARSSERFDRIEFALALLRLLKPPMTVAVYARSQRLELHRGRRGVGEPWAMLGIPPRATRENIVRALAELSGHEDAPFLIDLLCSTAPPAAPD